MYMCEYTSFPLTLPKCVVHAYKHTGTCMCVYISPCPLSKCIVHAYVHTCISIYTHVRVYMYYTCIFPLPTS